jgi:hypothetical protein
MHSEEEALLGDQAHYGPGVSTSNRKSKTQLNRNRFRGTAIFIATALIAGTCFFLIVGSFILSRPQLRASTHDYVFGSQYGSLDANEDGNGSGEAAPNVLTVFDTVTEFATTTQILDPPPPVPTLALDGILEMDLEELRTMVDSTNGYMARDWPLGLGWNNVTVLLLHGLAAR